MSIRAMIAKGMTARAISERTGISLEDIGRYMSATATRKLEELPHRQERLARDEDDALLLYGVSMSYADVCGGAA